MKFVAIHLHGAFDGLLSNRSTNCPPFLEEWSGRGQADQDGGTMAIMTLTVEPKVQ